MHTCRNSLRLGGMLANQQNETKNLKNNLNLAALLIWEGNAPTIWQYLIEKTYNSFMNWERET